MWWLTGAVGGTGEDNDAHDSGLGNPTDGGITYSGTNCRRKNRAFRFEHREQVRNLRGSWVCRSGAQRSGLGEAVQSHWQMEARVLEDGVQCEERSVVWKHEEGQHLRNIK